MPTTQSAYDWLRSRIAPTARPEGEPARERYARAEIDRLRAKIEHAHVARGNRGHLRRQRAVARRLHAVLIDQARDLDAAVGREIRDELAAARGAVHDVAVNAVGRVFFARFDDP